MRISEKLRLRLYRWAQTRMEKPQDFTIGEASNPYLHRWWVLRLKYLCCIYIHHFKSSDDDRALHDHPWHKLSILLEGVYVEHTKDGAFRREPGFIYFRSPWRAHRIELLKDAESGELLPVTTLFITGPKIRNWGFLCPQGFVPWWEYVSVRPGGNGIGRGCDE